MVDSVNQSLSMSNSARSNSVREESSTETSSLLDENWISWFCGLNGNHLFCEVDKTYIEDSFNLFGLKQYFNKDFNKVLETILDKIDPEEAERIDFSRSAAVLYGLIHARYIITASGLEEMHQKYLRRDFGECPRTFCKGQPVLPIGMTDEPKLGTLKLFCPKCQDIYNCHPSQRHIDGAYFGTTFSHLFMMTYEDLVPIKPFVKFTPRVFGFKIHPSSNSLPKQTGTPYSPSKCSGTNNSSYHFVDVKTILENNNKPSIILNIDEGATASSSIHSPISNIDQFNNINDYKSDSNDKMLVNNNSNDKNNQNENINNQNFEIKKIEKYNSLKYSDLEDNKNVSYSNSKFEGIQIHPNKRMKITE